MELTDFAKGAGWAILPDVFDTMADEFSRLQGTEKALDLAAAWPARSKGRDDRPKYDIHDGVALLAINGTLTKRQTFYSEYFGAYGYNLLSEIFQAAVDDPKVRSIVLSMDSPGGTVSGIEAFADLIYNHRGKKPLVAFANGQMTSAAYWAGSGADHIMAESTAQLGSIGVLMVHWDLSEWDKMEGIKRTYLTAGKYKALGNSAEPLSDLARSVLQEKLDYVYDVFIATVARHRNVDADTVRNDMADGRIFIGQQAVDAGLADAVGSLTNAMEKARALADAGGATHSLTAKESVMPNKNTPTATTPGSADELAAQFPQLAEQLRQQGAQSIDQDQIRSQAAEEERTRVLGLVRAHFGAEPGQAFEKIVATGVSVDQYEAIRGAETPDGQDSEAAARAAALEALKESGPDDPGSDTRAQGGKDFMTLVAEHQTVHKSAKAEAMQAVMKAHPEAHAAYLQEANKK